MRTAPTAIGVYVNPTMKVFSVDSVKKGITASLFAKVSIPKQVMFPQAGMGAKENSTFIKAPLSVCQLSQYQGFH